MLEHIPLPVNMLTVGMNYLKLLVMLLSSFKRLVAKFDFSNF